MIRTTAATFSTSTETEPSPTSAYLVIDTQRRWSSPRRRLPLPGWPSGRPPPGACAAAQVPCTAPGRRPPRRRAGQQRAAAGVRSYAVAPARRECTASPAPSLSGSAPVPPPPLELGLPAGIEFRMGAGREAGSWELGAGDRAWSGGCGRVPGLGRGREGRGAWAGHS